MGNKFVWFYALIFIELFILLGLIAPFILYNNLNMQDMPGHLFSAYYAKNFLFPDVAGWNPFFYLGMPQNQLYPPLFALLTALLSFTFGLDLAFKIVFSAAILATPLSFYYFARKLNFSREKSATATVVMTALMFSLKGLYGGNFIVSFNAGVVGHAIAVPILFFYLGSLKSIFEKNRIVVPSILLALLALSSVFMALVGIIVSLISVFYRFNKKNVVVYAEHAGLSFLISAFVTFPLLFKYKYSGMFYLPPILELKGLAPLLIFGLVSYLAFCAFRSKNKDMHYVAMSILVLFLSLVIGSILELNFHFYRLQLPIFLFSSVLAVSFANKKRNFIIISLLALFAMLDGYNDIDVNGADDVLIKNIGILDGRVLILQEINFDLGTHTLPHRFSMVTGNHVIKGSFWESAVNARILGDVINIIDNDTFVPYYFIHPLYADANNPKLKENIPKYLDFFNINYVISKEKKLQSELVQNDVITFRNKGYNLYRVGNSSMIEVLDYKPEVVKEGWDEKVGKWFFSDKFDKILVNENVPDYVGNGQEQITITEKTKNYHRIKFNVSSKKPVPILIKISYFPNWKAYANGKETKIYQASPYLMLIYGNGEIELRYEKLVVDYLGYILTFAGALIIAANLIKK